MNIGIAFISPRASIQCPLDSQFAPIQCLSESGQIPRQMWMLHSCGKDSITMTEWPLQIARGWGDHDLPVYLEGPASDLLRQSP